MKLGGVVGTWGGSKRRWIMVRIHCMEFWRINIIFIKLVGLLVLWLSSDSGSFYNGKSWVNFFLCKRHTQAFISSWVQFPCFLQEAVLFVHFKNQFFKYIFLSSNFICFLCHLLQPLPELINFSWVFHLCSFLLIFFPNFLRLICVFSFFFSSF